MRKAASQTPTVSQSLVIPPEPQCKPAARVTAFWSVAGIVVLIVSFCHVAFVVEPAVGHFYSAQPFFSTWEHFLPFLRWPGGPVSYLAAFFDAYNYDSLLSAGIFTTLVAALIFVSRWIFRTLCGAPAGWSALVLPLLMLVVRQQPASQATVLLLGLLVALSCALICAALPIESNIFRAVIGGALALTICYLAGPWPGLLFCLLLAVTCFIGKSSWSLPLTGLAAMLLGICLLHFSADLQPARWLKPPGGISGLVACLTVPAIALAYNFCNRFFLRFTVAKDVSPGVWLRSIGSLAVLSAIFGRLLWGNLDRNYLARARICYYSQQRSHAKVVAAARKLPLLDASSEIQLHLALYHLGRFSDDLFSFDNCRMATVLPGLSEGVAACRAQSETLFQLGHVGVAEHFAHEALEWDGNRPDILLTLAHVNVLKGRPKAAKVFLRVLSLIPGERNAALSYLEKLEAGISVDNPQLAEVGTRMPQTDLPHDYLAPEPLLRQLLHANNGNRMAFEYLMMHYLLNLDLDGFAAHLPLMQKHNYREVPKHFEEAALLYEKLRGKPLDLGGKTIRPETQGRFKEITAALDRREDQTADGRRALKTAFGDTFWLYYVMNRPAKSTTLPGGMQ